MQEVAEKTSIDILEDTIVIYQDGVLIEELAKTRNTLENMLGETTFYNTSQPSH